MIVVMVGDKPTSHLPITYPKGLSAVLGTGRQNKPSALKSFLYYTKRAHVRKAKNSILLDCHKLPSSVGAGLGCEMSHFGLRLV